jgi:hypothetical protein
MLLVKEEEEEEEERKKRRRRITNNVSRDVYSRYCAFSSPALVITQYLL